MERRLSIQKRRCRCNPAKSSDSTRHTRCELNKVRFRKTKSTKLPASCSSRNRPLLNLGGHRFEHRRHRRRFEIRRGDTFEVCTNAAQLRSHKRVDKVETPIKPCEKLALDLVMHSQRYLGAVWPNLRKIDQSHQINIAAHRFKCVLIGRLAVDCQEHCVRLETNGAAKAKVHCIR